MSCPESGQIDAAPPPPGFSTPTKAIRNDGAGHAGPDAERMEIESDADVEKEFEKSTGKKRRNAGPLVYRFVKEWTTGSQAKLEPKEIETRPAASSPPAVWPTSELSVCGIARL